jgi:hypothetical protein
MKFPWDIMDTEPERSSVEARRYSFLEIFALT